MREYEFVYIVHPEVDSKEGLPKVVDEIKALVESSGGTVNDVNVWGMRRLAYPIRKVREGQYVVMKTNLEPGSVLEIERRLKLSETVIRHLIVRTDED